MTDTAYTICLNCGYIEPNFLAEKRQPCCNKPTPRPVKHICTNPVIKQDYYSNNVYIWFNNYIAEAYWVLGIEEYNVEIAFCPFCGEKLELTVESE